MIPKMPMIPGKTKHKSALKEQSLNPDHTEGQRSNDIQ